MPGTPFVFLDRDGTLVRDEGYTHRISDYELLPGVAPALRRLVEAGFELAIVTNQSGIGRGYYTPEDFHGFQAHLVADLASAGVPVRASYHCPHRPEEGCPCRKPAPGMLWRARDELGADLGASWMVGDSWRDVELAQAAGCKGAVLIAGAAETAPAGGAPCRRAADLEGAAGLILQETRR